MNWLQQLFHRQPAKSAASTPPVCVWTGASGREYHYHIYPLDAELRPLPGNYLYARPLAAGGWMPVYVAQTRDLHQRLEGEIHPADAAQRGATHLHAHYNSAGQAARCEEERDLIKRWLPECNERPES